MDNVDRCWYKIMPNLLPVSSCDFLRTEVDGRCYRCQGRWSDWMSWHGHCLGRSYWSRCFEGCLWRAARTNFLSRSYGCFFRFFHPSPETLVNLAQVGSHENCVISTVRTQMFFMRVSWKFIPRIVPWRSSERIWSKSSRNVQRTSLYEVPGYFSWRNCGFFLKTSRCFLKVESAKDWVQCGTGCSQDEHCTLGGFRWHCWILEATRIYRYFETGNRRNAQKHQSLHTMEPEIHLLIKGSLDEKLPSYEVLKMLKE